MIYNIYKFGKNIQYIIYALTYIKLILTYITNINVYSYINLYVKYNNIIYNNKNL